MSKILTVGSTALFTCVLCAMPLSLGLSPEGNVSLSANSASAEIGRPLTPMSVAGVNRRAHRRAYRRDYNGYGANYGQYGYGYGTYRGWGAAGIGAAAVASPYNYGYAYDNNWGGATYQGGPRSSYTQRTWYGSPYRDWTQY